MSTAIIIAIIVAYIAIVSIVLLIFHGLRDRNMSETKVKHKEKDDKHEDFLEKAS